MTTRMTQLDCLGALQPRLTQPDSMQHNESSVRVPHVGSELGSAVVLPQRTGPAWQVPS